MKIAYLATAHSESKQAIDGLIKVLTIECGLAVFCPVLAFYNAEHEDIADNVNSINDIAIVFSDVLVVLDSFNSIGIWREADFAYRLGIPVGVLTNRVLPKVSTKDFSVFKEINALKGWVYELQANSGDTEVQKSDDRTKVPANR
jgi:hypothetical protein